MNNHLTRHLISLFVIGLLLFNPGTLFAAPDQTILDKARQSEAAILSNLETLVNIDSGTGDEKGLNKVAQFMMDQLKDLGASVETVPATTGVGPNIIATFEGSGKGKILILTHMDTVFGPGTAAARPFRIDGNRAYGPGVSDEKGGIVLGLQAIKLLKDLGYENYAKITWLLNPDEEKGSFGSRDLIKKAAAEHDYTLCLEPGVPGDAINPWRKGIGYYILTVKGRSAHAGIEPEAGRNAAMEAAFQILQLANLGDPKKMTTLNWTLIKSGDRTNVIPDLAIAQADVRVLYADEYDRLEKDINRIIQKKLIPDTTVTLEARKGRPPFAKNAKSDALAAKLQGIYAELDMKLGSVGSGGGSDANYAASVGATAIDGLGIVGGGDHTPDEYIEIKSIVPRLYLLTRTLMDLGAGK